MRKATDGRGRLTSDDSTGHNIIMPIKFRCPHCRQFLGVSRAKAGSLADCPSCGRAIRIPQLDGKVGKVPAPELNLNNTGLRKALDSLAQLAPPNEGVGDVETYDDDQAAMPVPQPEAEPSFPLVATAPKHVVESVRSSVASLEPLMRSRVAVELPSEFDASTADEHQNGKAVVTPLRETIDPRPTPPNADAFVPSLAALAQLADAPDAVSLLPKSQSSPIPVTTSRAQAPETSVRSVSARVESRTPTPSYRTAHRSRTSLVLTSLVSLMIGGGIGAFIMHTLPKNDATEPSSAANAVTPEQEPLSTGELIGPVGLTGRVNFIDQDGQSRPDAGSRVLVLPADREGTVLLSAEAFRSGADAADRRIAEAALTAMGGAFVTVDEHGEYRASLPAAASFHVLIMSQHTANDLQGGHAADLLEDYVDRPAALLGRVAWTVYSIRHTGSGSQPLDHTFVPPQDQ